MRFRRFLLLGALSLAPSVVLAACGARTPLIVPDHADVDAEIEAEVGRDVRRDVVPDTLPPIDATPLDAYRNDCPDADSTLVYVVTEQNELLSFYPPDATFKKIGTIKCPSGSNPFSMGVDRKGVAQVLFMSGELFRVSTLTASCQATGFKSNPTFTNFGMAYSTIGVGPAEDLFIIALDGVLGHVDFMTNQAIKIADTVPNLPKAELTGTGDGRLYGFYSDDNTGGTGIAEIDKMTGKVLGADPMPTLTMGTAWAFAFWGGDFYLFTAPNGTSDVHRYRPSDKSLKLVGGYNGAIVGAGVSTCAPQQ
jgi:hypothetical protein